MERSEKDFERHLINIYVNQVIKIRLYVMMIKREGSSERPVYVQCFDVSLIEFRIYFCLKYGDCCLHKRGRKNPTIIQSTNFKVQEKCWPISSQVLMVTALFTNDSKAFTPLKDKYCWPIIDWPIHWADLMCLDVIDHVSSMSKFLCVQRTTCSDFFLLFLFLVNHCSWGKLYDSKLIIYCLLTLILLWNKKGTKCNRQAIPLVWLGSLRRPVSELCMTCW